MEEDLGRLQERCAGSRKESKRWSAADKFTVVLETAGLNIAH